MTAAEYLRHEIFRAMGVLMGAISLGLLVLILWRGDRAKPRFFIASVVFNILAIAVAIYLVWRCHWLLYSQAGKVGYSRRFGQVMAESARRRAKQKQVPSQIWLHCESDQHFRKIKEVFARYKVKVGTTKDLRLRLFLGEGPTDPVWGMVEASDQTEKDLIISRVRVKLFKGTDPLVSATLGVTGSLCRFKQDSPQEINERLANLVFVFIAIELEKYKNSQSRPVKPGRFFYSIFTVSSGWIISYHVTPRLNEISLPSLS